MSKVTQESLLAAERHRQILALLEESGSVRVAHLSRLFKVTEETIRRDLEKLEADGLLKRIHGGAVRPEGEGFEIPYLERQEQNRAEKEAIAREAAKLVSEGDIIAIDASTTGLALARLLGHHNITVLTNSMGVALELSTKKPSVILIGGRLQKESLSFVGQQVDRVVSDYYVDKFFFSCAGFHPQRGVSESHEEQAQAKRKLMSIASERILLMDHSKYGVRSLSRVADPSQLDRIITDEGLAMNHLKELRDLGVEVHIASLCN